MPPADRVIVFVDYQNLYATARTIFGHHSDPPQQGHVWPLALGELIAARRSRPSVLREVRVYRGLPDSEKQPTLHAVNSRQTLVWTGDRRVTVFNRPLRYPSDWPVGKPMEKGIDVALAVDLVRLAHQGAYDTAVVFSRDTDLMPALEAVNEMRIPKVHIEVATWKGAGRLRFSSTNLPWCHMLDQDDYQAVQDTTDYLRPKQL